ncbi:MAG: hypothetical protein ACRDT4_04855 [Micromonosporaceae bacterium]
MGTLEDDNIPITPAERRNLEVMLRYLNEPEIGRTLDQLNVTAASGS